MKSPAHDPAASAADWFVRHRLKLRHLKVVLAIERARNIGRAAQELHTSQPAVSKALQEVERAAGMALFERRADGTYPTPAGESLIRYARDVFGTLERAGRELGSIADGMSGSLSIGSNFSSAADLLPRAIVLLKRAHPRVFVSVREASLEILLPDLRARKVDVVVARWTRGRQIGDLEEHALFEQPMCVVSAPNHPLARAKRVSWKALAGHPWILPPQGSAVRDDLEELFRLERIRPREAGIECASAFANSILMRDLGVLAVAPAAVARPLKAERLLCILPVKIPPVFGPNSAITLLDRAHTPAMRAFLDALSQAARPR